VCVIYYPHLFISGCLLTYPSSYGFEKHKQGLILDVIFIPLIAITLLVVQFTVVIHNKVVSKYPLLGLQNKITCFIKCAENILLFVACFVDFNWESMQ